MVKDDIGGLIAEGLGGEIVQPQSGPEVIDMTTPNTENKQETSTQEVSNEKPQEEIQEVKQETSVENKEPSVPTFTEQEENKPIEEETPKQEENLQNDSSFLNEINDSFETDFGSVAELKEAINELISQEDSEPEIQYANEQVANIDKFVRETGRNVSDYLRTQTTDYSKLSDEQIVKEYLKVSNPELTSKEIDVYYNANYSAEKSENGEPTLSQIQLKKDASTARKELTKVQDSYKMPMQENDSEYSQEELEAIQSEWLNSMEDEVNSVDSVSFDINDNETFDFKLTDEHKQKLAESNAGIDNYFDRYIDESGNWDFDKLNMDMFIRDNFEDIVRSVANQYRSKGTEQVINDIKNPSFDKDQTPTGTGKKSILEQVSDKILGDGNSFWQR